MVPAARVIAHAIVLPVITTCVTQTGAMCVVLCPDTLFHGQFYKLLNATFRARILGNPSQDIGGAYRCSTIGVICLDFVPTGQGRVAVVGCQDFQVFGAALSSPYPGGNNVRHSLPQALLCHCLTSHLLALKFQCFSGGIYRRPAGAVFPHDTISQASAVQRVQGYRFLGGLCHPGGSTATALVFQISKVHQGGRGRHADFQPMIYISGHVLFCQAILGLLSGVRGQQGTDHFLFLGIHYAVIPVCGRGDLTIKGSAQNRRRPAFCRTDRF